MLTKLPFIEAEIDILGKVRAKAGGCSFATSMDAHGISCSLYKYNLHTAMEMLAHCSVCKFNTKKPTQATIKTRFL